MDASWWTVDRCELLRRLVRRHAFDFDATSQAFQGHFKSECAGIGPEDASPTSLRKVFASLDRIRTLSTDCSSSYTGVQCQPHQLKLSNQDEENHGPEQKVVENQPNNSLNDGALMQKLRTRLRDPSTNTLCTRDPKVVEEENIHPYQQIMSLGEVNVNLQNGQAGKTDGAWAPQNGDTTSSEPDWSFESFVQDQRSIEKKHEAHKESTFQKVLSALGGPTADAAELSPDVLLAWKKRKDSLAKVEANAEERRNKRKEDEDLSLQREKLKKRHLPGGEDSIGDDPLSSPLGDSAASSPCSSFQCEGPVRLELGMDAEVLDKVLAELEESLISDDKEETNSELSQILDVLDEAAGDITAAGATILSSKLQGRQ